MQGHWTMRFRGEKESIQKLTAILEKKQDEWSGGCPDFTWKEEDDILFQSNCSANVRGMSEEFVELVQTFPELEAAYCDSRLDDNWNVQYVYYSKAGTTQVKGPSQADYHHDSILRFYLEGEDPVEYLTEKTDMSTENAEKVVALLKYKITNEGKCPEPFAFDFVDDDFGDEAHFDSEMGYFACEFDGDCIADYEIGTQDGELWVWVPYGAGGTWYGVGHNDFIEKMLDEAH